MKCSILATVVALLALPFAAFAQTNPDRLFFQNDWDGNDRDGRNCARYWGSENMDRHATALHDELNDQNNPAGSLSFTTGATRVANASKTGNITICMGGGAGQLLRLLKKVDDLGGNLNNIKVISHSTSNKANIDGKAGQYPPFGPSAWNQVKNLVGDVVEIPNQNDYAYGSIGTNRSTDCSDFGMIHYAKYNQSRPTSRRLFN